MSDDFFLSDDDSDNILLDDEQTNERKPQEKLSITEMEQVAEAHVSEILQGFKQRSAREQERYMDAVDSEYWVALCFQTREQKEEFLEKLKLIEYGDKHLDGMAVARVLGVELTSRVPDMPIHKVDSEWGDMALNFDD